jgi:hypothetical protein
METSRRPVAVFGPLEPVVRSALMASWAGEVEIRECDASGPELAAAAVSNRAAAVVVRHRDLDRLSACLAADVLVLAVGVGTGNVTVCRGENRRSVPNPSPQALAHLVRDYVA